MFLFDNERPYWVSRMETFLSHLTGIYGDGVFWELLRFCQSLSKTQFLWFRHVQLCKDYKRVVFFLSNCYQFGLESFIRRKIIFCGRMCKKWRNIQFKQSDFECFFSFDLNGFLLIVFFLNVVNFLFNRPFLNIFTEVFLILSPFACNFRHFFLQVHPVKCSNFIVIFSTVFLLYSLETF